MEGRNLVERRRGNCNRDVIYERRINVKGKEWTWKETLYKDGV